MGPEASEEPSASIASKSAGPIDTTICESDRTHPDDSLAASNDTSNSTSEAVKKPFSFCELKPMFGVKYRNLKVDKFWKKKSKSKKTSSLPSTSSISTQLLQAKKQESFTPKVTTKAAMKEIVNMPLMTSSKTSSTKTMLAVLKSMGLKSKPGRKKERKRE